MAGIFMGGGQVNDEILRVIARIALSSRVCCQACYGNPIKHPFDNQKAIETSPHATQMFASDDKMTYVYACDKHANGQSKAGAWHPIAFADDIRALETFLKDTTGPKRDERQIARAGVTGLGDVREDHARRGAWAGQHGLGSLRQWAETATSVDTISAGEFERACAAPDLVCAFLNLVEAADAYYAVMKRRPENFEWQEKREVWLKELSEAELDYSIARKALGGWKP
jgi:hypothetical protein